MAERPTSRRMELAGRTVVEMAETGDFMPAPVREKALRVGREMKDMVRWAHTAGVPIAFGTDSGVSPHGKTPGNSASSSKRVSPRRRRSGPPPSMSASSWTSTPSSRAGSS